MIILERFEGEWAVLEMEECVFQVPRELLPPEAREGACLSVAIAVDEQASLEREQAIRKMFDQLF